MSLQERMRELFLLDQQVRGLRGRLDGAMSRQSKQAARLEQLRRQRAELGEQLKQVQAKATGLEHQARDIDQRVEALRTQMNSVKNNKEYSALLTEVSTLKNDKGKLEDEALEHLTKLDALKAEAAALDAKVEEQRKLLAVTEGEVAAARAEVGQQLEELTAKRDAAERDLPQEAKSAFRRAANAHEGEAMASIVEESRRHMEYSCGGCYIGLPVERVNAVMRHPDQIVACPSCGRILYMDQELKSSMSAK